MRHILLVAVGLLVTACASAPSSGARNSNVITRAEIEDSHQVNALELVHSARPHWLRRRGPRTVANDTDVVIYLDGTRFGGPETLANVATMNVEELRYYTEGEAQYRFGVGHPHGVIEVITRRGG